jgi:hypothetical protein
MGDDVGSTALLYSGMDNSSTSSYAYLKVFDLSSQNVVVSSDTTLSYWVFPQSSNNYAGLGGSNSTCVAIDLIFTDGTNLRDSGAVDQNGNRVHPAAQCGHLKLDQWNLVTSNIGAVVSGKTISRIDIGYDQPGNTGGYRGYFDDISLTTGHATLFSSGFESGQPQPTWTNTVDGSGYPAGGINNIGGLCCGLTGPEAGTRQETAHWSGTSLPALTFSYTSLTEHYEDDAYHPNPSTNCGPSWNSSACLLWSQSYAGNSRYLATADNGQGLHQVFNWAEGRNNTHGVNGGGTNALNPLYCDGKEGQGYPCSQADDQNWSHAVLTQEQDSVIRSSQNGQGGQQTNTTITSTTSYSYQLTPFSANPCSDCLQGMYWGNQNDADYLDFYNGKFMGFNQTTVTNPDGSVEVHQYFGGLGWGIYDTSQVTCYSINPCHNDAWWTGVNALHGHEYATYAFDTNGTTLLKKTVNWYAWTCPPSGASGSGSTSYGNFNGNLVSELDHNNPVAACDLQTSRVDTYTYDGSAYALHQQVDYTHDSYGRLTSQTTTNDARLEAELLPVVSNTAPWSSQSNCCGVTWSGNQQLLFGSTAPNNSITLQFQVPAAGTYAVAALETQASDFGIHTLAVDGTQVGSAVDAYSSTVTTAQVSYGQVTLSAGQHTLTLTVTDKNSASSNYRGGWDYFTLTPTTRLEAETLPVVSATAPVVALSNCCGTTWSGNEELDFAATAANNSVTLRFQVPVAGTYALTALDTLASNSGIYTLAIDGTAVGSAVDEYSSTVTTTLVPYGRVSLSAGQHTYRVEAKDNVIKFFVDGGLLITLTDNLYLTGSQVGLWCFGVQLSVFSFQVMSL